MKRLSSIANIILALVLVCATAGRAAAETGAIKSVDKAGRTHVAEGYVAMKAAPDAKTFAAAPEIANASLPGKVDLRSKMTPIEDQGATMSCVANAVAGSFEYWVKQATQQDYDVSRMFVYYNARWRNGDEDKDAGCVIQLAMEGLKEFGACNEERWPFSKALLFTTPNREAYEEAGEVKITEMERVPMELEAWKQALASGYPVVFGCLLFDSFDQCNARGGVVPMPSPEDLGRSSHGGHSMCAVGYSDKEEVFIVRNSWGDKWGDKGYCYMPYNYLINPKFNNGDSWVFVPETPIENPQDTWFDDDNPVTDDGRGVDFVINPYKVEDYVNVVVPLWETITVEYNDTPPVQYNEYVEYSEANNWEAMESFDQNEVIETWETEHPDEDSNLYIYDNEDADAEAEAEAEVEEDADDSGDEDAEAEESEDEGEDEDADAEDDVEEDVDDSGDEEAEEEESEDEGEDDEADAEDDVEEDVDDSGDEDAEEEESEDEGEGDDTDAEDDVEEDVDDSGDEDAGEHSEE